METTHPIKDIYSNHLRVQPGSGLSMRAYCSEHKLNYSRFCYCRKKEKESSKSSAESSSFIQAKVKEAEKGLFTSPSVTKSPSQVIDPVWLAQFVQSVWGVK